MTTKLFWDNPYQTDNEALITSVHDSVVTVDETVFYALSGGQESDAGTIAGLPVIEAAKVGREIEYTLPKDHNLRKDQKVTIHIDWERRYKLMRLHFAAELVLQLLYKTLPGIQKIGAHIAEAKARIDFEWPESLSSLFPQIIRELNVLVESDEKIISAFSSKEDERRYWKIESFAQVPCGGTHLSRTGELGAVSLKRKNIGRGKERVEIFLV